MRNTALWMTVCALAVIFLLVADTSAQSSSKIYGYVSVDGSPTNGVIVVLSGEGILGPYTNVTANDSGGAAGYYEFVIENGSGRQLGVSASYDNRSGSYNFIMRGDTRANLNLVASPTPTPTPTPEPTPTPRPSGDLGGLVTRNDSLFIPVPITNLAATPTPKPSRGPTAAPTSEPTPIPAPAAGILSNIYVWLVIALLAILIIAAAILIYLRK